MSLAAAALAAVLAFVVILAAGEREAEAAPQVSVGTTIGGAITDLRTDGPHAAFHLGLRGDALFFRSRDANMAIGPYLELLTEAFDSLETGGGVSWLAPVWPSVPFVVSAGAYARRAPGLAWEPGVTGQLFFGPRGYNFHSVYGLADGLFVQGRYGLGDGKQADVVIGAQIDLAVVALPFLFVYEGLAH